MLLAMICFTTLSIWTAMTCKRLFLLDLLSSQCPRNVPHYYDRINKGFEAACQKEYPNRPDWKEIIGYHVEPVKIPAGGRASGLLKFLPPTVLYLIYGYLEGCPKAFYVKAESLRKLGFASAARGARKQASHYRGGHWAAIKTNTKLKAIASFYGKMVRVVGVHTRVHLANVSASLDLEPHLNAPLQSDRTMRNPGGHVWHAAMIHHRCKMLTICDSACERYFSLLHSIFDEDRSLAPHRMANRLLLREASVSCLGGARDEALIDQLAEILMNQFGKKPLKRDSDGKSSSCKMQELTAQSNTKAQNKQLSLFGNANLGSYFQGMGPDALSAVEDLAKKHAPATLDPDSSERARRARQDALPRFVVDQRTARKALAPSTMQEKLNQWLQSNDGEGWLHSRHELEPGSGSSRFQLFDQWDTKLCLLFVCDYSVIIAENMDWGLHCLEQEMVRSFSKVTGALLFFKTLQMTSLDQTDK